MLDTMDDIKAKILHLIDNEDSLENLKINARKTFNNKLNIENMFDGFVKAIKYVE